MELTKTQLKKELKKLNPKKTLKTFLIGIGKNSRSLSRYGADEKLPRVYGLELFYLLNKDVAKKYNFLMETVNSMGIEIEAKD